MSLSSSQAETMDKYALRLLTLKERDSKEAHHSLYRGGHQLLPILSEPSLNQRFRGNMVIAYRTSWVQSSYPKLQGG